MPHPNVTALLEQYVGGDAAALDRLFPLVYEELRRVARGQMHAERSGHTLAQRRWSTRRISSL